MIILGQVVSWVLPVLASRNGMIGMLILGLLVTVFMWDRGRISAAESRGEKGAIQKVQNANDIATKKGRNAALRSGSPAKRGVCPEGYRGC